MPETQKRSVSIIPRPSEDLFLSRTTATVAMPSAAETTDLRAESSTTESPVALPPAGRSILKSPTRARSPEGGKRHLTYHPSVLVWDAAENEDEKELLRLLKSGEKASRKTKDGEVHSLYRPEQPLDVNMSNHEGVTLLHLLCFTGSATGLKALLQKGADPNRADREGWTPLHVAAATRRKDIFRLLLSAGAEMPPLCNEQGCLGLSSVTDDKEMLGVCAVYHQPPFPYRKEQSITLPKTVMVA